MKARLLSIPIIALMISAALTLTGEALTGEELARKSGCFECHGVSERNIGPTFQELASRYQGDPGARDFLITKVKQGGKGNWTEISRGVPMPPYWGRLTDEDIRLLVDWVLSLQ